MSNPYSDKDFTGQDLSDRLDMNGLIIENSCFSQEIPHRKIFPALMSGITFKGCNLDNCFIPPGNIVSSDCSRKVFKVQNDGEDWLIDPDTLQPLQPINNRDYLKYNLSIDPLNIPAQRLEKSILAQKQDQLNIARQIAIDQAIQAFDSINLNPNPIVLPEALPDNAEVEL